jgi:hypothetical protein
VVLAISHPLPNGWTEYGERPKVIYCPVDRFGSTVEIDANAG